MVKILKSLMIIVAVTTVAVSSTSAYFSSKATVTGNTFSTGTLEVRVNSEPSVVGASFSSMAPGQIVTSPKYSINNYGQPWFSGSSTLSAKKLHLTIVNPNDSGSGLWDVVRLKIEVSRDSGATWHTAYEGGIKYLYESYADLLNPVGYTELIPGSSVDMRYSAVMTDTGVDQNSLVGKTLTWDFSVEGRTN